MNDFAQRWQSALEAARRSPVRDDTAPFGFGNRIAALRHSTASASSAFVLWWKFTWRAIGVAALVLSVDPGLTPSEVETIMAQSATDLGAPGYDTLYGFGFVNAYQAVRRVLSEELGIDPAPSLRSTYQRILQQDPSLETTARRLRGYRLAEQIGAGSFGVVYRAFQPHVDREVAINVVHPRLANDGAFVRRFEAEAQLVARLEHPHIVPLYDYWREPDAAYLVMRLLRGGSLKDRVSTDPMDVEQVADLLDQVASALAAAHAQGVVHRDVKAANILLDGDGNAYLSDFGIARDLEGDHASDPTASP